MEKFLIIVITMPDSEPAEARKIVDMLDNGVDYIHIRKPDWAEQQVSELLNSIPENYHPRLKLHDNFNLTQIYNIGGIHLNGRNPVPDMHAKKISATTHSIVEIDTRISNTGYELEYMTLSPVFDSISKSGYKSKFNLNGIESKIKGKNVIALGGVTPGRLKELYDSGFRGAAMLGCAWSDVDGFIKSLNDTMTSMENLK